MFQKRTEITRPFQGHDDWVELWVGDKIKCRVYDTDRAGSYRWVENAEVIWDEYDRAFCIKGWTKSDYGEPGSMNTVCYPVNKILRDKESNVFIHKVDRRLGDTEEVVWHILEMLRSYEQEPPELDASCYATESIVSPEQAISSAVAQMVDTITADIGANGILPREQIKAFMETTR